MLVALLSSPFLGPAAWSPVAARLGDVLVPSVPVPRSADALAAAYGAALPADRDLAVVAHSNAGLYVPGRCATHRVRAALFVDALLPTSGPVPVAPAAFRERLAGLAGPGGLLPPWTDWWDEADVAPLFPDTATRARIEAGQPRVPLSYVTSTVPVAPGWDAGVCGGYLAFGSGYAAERADAAGRGWAVETLPGGHLHMLIDPDSVAGWIAERVTAAQ